MNIVSWNVRGLGKPAKRFLVKDFLNLHFVVVCYLQESKLELVSRALWGEIGGTHLDQCALVPAKSSSDGIIVDWNSVVLNGRAVSVGEFSLTIEFCFKLGNFLWWCTSVNGPVLRSWKSDF